MAHEFESGFFVKTPAWHKLGTVLNAAPTIEQALQLAGLDWTVRLEQLGWHDGAGEYRKAKRWSVIRDTDNTELGTVGPDWRPLQNQKAFAWFQPIVDQGLATLEAAGSLRGGARVWILAKVAAPADVIVPQSNDRVDRYILLAHGHDGVLAIRAGVTPVRVVCQNTLSAAIAGNNLIRIFHAVSAQATLEAVREIILRANKAFDRAAEAYRALAQVKNVSAAQLRAYVDAVFPKKKTQAEVQAEAAADFEKLLQRPTAPRASIFSPEVGDMTKETKSLVYQEVARLFEKGTGNDMPGVKGTAWAAYNAMTEFLTHERGRDADSRLNNSFFGPQGPTAVRAAAEIFLGDKAVAAAA